MAEPASEAKHIADKNADVETKRVANKNATTCQDDPYVNVVLPDKNEKSNNVTTVYGEMNEIGQLSAEIICVCGQNRRYEAPWTSSTSSSYFELLHKSREEGNPTLYLLRRSPNLSAKGQLVPGCVEPGDGSADYSDCERGVGASLLVLSCDLR